MTNTDTEQITDWLQSPIVKIASRRLSTGANPLDLLEAVYETITELDDALPYASMSDIVGVLASAEKATDEAFGVAADLLFQRGYTWQEVDGLLPRSEGDMSPRVMAAILAHRNRERTGERAEDIPGRYHVSRDTFYRALTVDRLRRGLALVEQGWKVADAAREVGLAQNTLGNRVRRGATADTVTASRRVPGAKWRQIGAYAQNHTYAETAAHFGCGKDYVYQSARRLRKELAAA